MLTHARKGFALALAIAIVAVLVIAAGVVYYFGFRQGEQRTPMAGEAPQGVQEEVEETGGVTPAPVKSFFVQLQAQNNSGMTGTAYFSEEANGQTNVLLMMAGVASSVARPAHIHAGACPTPGGVAFPLADVVEGKSETLIPVDFPRLADRMPLAVNVHKSMAELTQYVACGDIPAENLNGMMPASSADEEKKNEEGAGIMMEVTGMAGEKSVAGQYIAYSPEIYDANKDKKRVLYFYASWCPTCRPADAEFQSRRGEIPADVAVIRVNYNDPDTDREEKDLAKQYRVTYQHTFVQIDSSGSQVKIWNGGSIDKLLAELR